MHQEKHMLLGRLGVRMDTLAVTLAKWEQSGEQGAHVEALSFSLSAAEVHLAALLAVVDAADAIDVEHDPVMVAARAAGVTLSKATGCYMMDRPPGVCMLAHRGGFWRVTGHRVGGDVLEIGKWKTLTPALRALAREAAWKVPAAQVAAHA